MSSRALFALLTANAVLSFTAHAQTADADGELEEVVVTGSYTAQSMNSATGLTMTLRETPQTVTVITEQMIEDKGLVDMGQVLEHVPGISQVGDASEDAMIFIRGFQLDSAVQVDGMITTPANVTYSGALSQGIDTAVVERVEVLKGAAGILGGLGEPSATVNMIRKRPTDTFQSSLSLSGGSWNAWRAEGDVAGPISKDGSLRGRFVAAGLDQDYFIDRYHRRGNVVYGIVDKSFEQGTKLSLIVDRVASHYTGVYNWSSNPAYYTNGQLIDHDVSYSTGQKWAYRKVNEWSVMPELEHKFDSGWTLRSSYRYAKGKINVLNATLGSYVDPVSLNLFSPWGQPNALKSDRESDTQSFNVVTTGQFPLFGREHDLVFGYNYARNTFVLRGNSYYLQTATLNQPIVPAPNLSASYSYYANRDVSAQGGVYGTVRFSLMDRLKLMAGGRVSHWKLDSSDADTGVLGSTAKKSNVVTPYFGVVFDLNSFASLYASHTGIFLPNSVYGADGNILDPTEGTNNELGVKLAFYDNRLNISAAVYEATKDNVAQWLDVPQLPNGEWVYESIDGVKTKGYEIEAAGTLTPNWEISGGYTHNTAEDKYGEPRTTYIPDDVFKFTTSYKLSSLVPGLTVGGSTRWQSYTYSDNSVYSSTTTSVNVRQEQPAYWLLDLMARYPITDSLAVSVNVNNVLDKRYNRSMWGYSDFGEPRNFTVAARLKF
ncbi:MAG: TonB-dependent siderophore receptor [Steroidobacteraceae bacterium]